MFTGLVEEEGTIKALQHDRGSVVFTIAGNKTLKDLRPDDSIAVDGVCLTVIRKSKTSFDVQAVEETLRKTTLGILQVGDLVNLERPLLSTDRLGGHFVLGHIDTTGTIETVEARGSSKMFWIRVSNKFVKYLIPVGSIAVDGVSLTIASLRNRDFGVSIIPHTMEVTKFKKYKVGSKVNIEFDVLGKYAETMLRAYRR